MFYSDFLNAYSSNGPLIIVILVKQTSFSLQLFFWRFCTKPNRRFCLFAATNHQGARILEFPYPRWIGTVASFIMMLHGIIRCSKNPTFRRLKSARFMLNILPSFCHSAGGVLAEVTFWRSNLLKEDPTC